jgi:hypothetical protein
MTPRTQSRWYAGPSSIVVAALGFALGACAPVPTTQNSTNNTTPDTTSTPVFNMVEELHTDSASGNCVGSWEAKTNDSTVEVDYELSPPAGPKNGNFFDSLVVNWTVPDTLSYKVTWSMSTPFWAAQDSFIVAPNSCPGKDSI